MAKSPFSSAGGGNADTSPYSMRANGGGVKASAKAGGNIGQIDGKKNGGALAKLEKAEASPNPKTRKAAMKAEAKK
jgi:hypothetical protein